MNFKRCFVCGLLTVVLLAACKKAEAPVEPAGDDGPLTEQEKQAIIQTYQRIAVTADSILLGADPIAGFQQMLASYRSFPNVKNAWIDRDILYVEFKKGVLTQWYVAPDVVIPPYDHTPTLSPTVHVAMLRREGSANTRVGLINVLHDDERRAVYREYMNFLKKEFDDAGFQATIINTGAADQQFFRTGLTQFGVIILFTHGGHESESGVTWLLTGEEGTIEQFVRQFPNEPQPKRVSLFTQKETINGVEVEKSRFAISDRFIGDSYAAGSFPGTVLYLGACETMRGDRPLANVLVTKGAAAVIGWTAKNSVGPSASKRFSQFLLCGKSVEGSIRALPREDKTDNHANSILVFHPESAGNIRIVSTERRTTLVMTRPQNDSTYTNRSLQIEGSAMSNDTLREGIAEVNGVALQLEVSGNRRSFSQLVVIKGGNNIVRIIGIVKRQGGQLACVDTTIRFKGQFDPLVFWSQLRWNTVGTDVDFHLLPPNAVFPRDFWTSTDCYYANRTPLWGGFLDQDNTTGRGPEHITIPTLMVHGTYRLFVHYYSSGGVRESDAFVTVSANDGPYKESGPLKLTSAARRGGDIWEVYKITLPEGTVELVKTKRSAGGGLAKPGDRDSKEKQ